jgi:hypothetical protein
MRGCRRSSAPPEAWPFACPEIDKRDARGLPPGDVRRIGFRAALIS